MDYPVTDVPGPTSSLRALEMHLLHHTRHYQVMAASLESFEQWLGIADVLARGGDISRLITSGIAVGSPLVLNQLNGELLVRSVETGFRDRAHRVSDGRFDRALLPGRHAAAIAHRSADDRADGADPAPGASGGVCVRACP